MEKERKDKFHEYMDGLIRQKEETGMIEVFSIRIVFGDDGLEIKIEAHDGFPAWSAMYGITNQKLADILAQEVRVFYIRVRNRLEKCDEKG